MVYKDFEEIRELMKRDEPFFKTLDYERDQIGKLLDAYIESLIYLDTKNQPVKHIITDKTSEDIYGVDGRLHYTTKHRSVVEKLLKALFTSSNKIWIDYNPSDHSWSGERDRIMREIRKTLIRDMVPRLVRLVQHCQNSQLQFEEA